MICGIVGGGFGIYGWLSALSKFKKINIATLTKYKETLIKRKDISNLHALVKTIKWFDKEEILYKNVDVLVIARRPSDQTKIIKNLIKLSWKGSLIIEKPIASSSNEAKIILKQLFKNNIYFQTGFSIMETDWAKIIQHHIITKSPKEVSIEWNFYAHHHSKKKISWKSDPNLGGGALNFYCIHFIAWFVSFSNWNVVSCSPLSELNNDSNVEFKLSNENTILNMSCNTKNKKHTFLKITENSENQNNVILNLDNPFSENKFNNEIYDIDLRVPYLCKIVKKVINKQKIDYALMTKHINLWENLQKSRRSNNSIF